MDIFIGISSKANDHPEWHPNLLYEELNEMAIADIRRRLALGAKSVTVEIVEKAESGLWIKIVRKFPKSR